MGVNFSIDLVDKVGYEWVFFHLFVLMVAVVAEREKL